ncbi:methyltransferase [Candidatus Woesearchaeota archaeon CG11_big_fil_rev_8_21_14_0_20_43_8]|nr:MAG: methyltransferase [Candidatus Woesearchaeota archaeon CG11_big_fil_rev_8_21_14_0_20_43_8]PIO04864.1 MAG: methyltransferase [Candidatus Woesearchaeota archaeon CG08_land_8_20_14_0_20_43_7]
MMLEDYPIEELQKAIDSASEISSSEEILEIAKAREKNSKTKENYLFTRDDLRFATPDIVADYRAKRLKCRCILDIGCGVGLQSIAFAKTCDKVIGVDIDERKIRYAKINASIADVKNIEFFHLDALSDETLFHAKEADIIFCDTERPTSQEHRKLDDVRPSPLSIVERFSGLTEDIAIEVPPFLDDIPMDCEKEYLSVDHRLNRLTIYFGNLRKEKLCAVSLPNEETLASSVTKKTITRSSVKRFLHEVDTSIIRAGLDSELALSTGTSIYVKKKRSLLLTSDEMIDNPFIKDSYRVLCVTNEENIKEELKRHDAEKVILRADVDPKDYWTIRKKYEVDLIGKKMIHLFINDGELVLSEKI